MATYEAHIQGRAAALAGEPPSACPYPVTSLEGRAWQGAWLRAEHHRQALSGESERRTEAMRAEAQRTAELWEPRRYAPNPVDALMAEVADAPRTQMVGVSITPEQVRVALERIGEVAMTFVDALTPAFRLAAQLVSDLGDILNEVEQKMPAQVERKRHGAASVCPRHGVTKGGLCRRCAR